MKKNEKKTRNINVRYHVFLLKIVPLQMKEYVELQVVGKEYDKIG